MSEVAMSIIFMVALAYALAAILSAADVLARAAWARFVR